MIVLIVSLIMLGLILVRVPVAFAILSAGILGLVLLEGMSATIGVLETVPLSAIGKNSLAAIPLFILMAQFALRSGALAHLFDAARVIIGRVRGGTAFAAIGAGGVFASVSGSSTAAAATLAHTSTGQLIDQGYSPRLSAGVVASAGTLAAMIPPSVLLVFYAITADAPVGQTLVAGLVPGLLVTAALALTVGVIIAMRQESAPRGESSTWMEKVRSLAGIAPMAILFLLVVGLVFMGITTATEAAAIGAVGGLVLMVIRKEFNLTNLNKALHETASSSVMIFSIIFAAHVFGHFITESQITPQIVETLSELSLAPTVVVAAIALGYLVLGFFMDQMAIIALTVPVTLPVVMELGFDPIWFGVVVILMAEVGLITPPLGLNVFVVARAGRLPVETVFSGSVPFVASILAVGVLIFLVPDIVLFLPGLME